MNDAAKTASDLAKNAGQSAAVEDAYDRLEKDMTAVKTKSPNCPKGFPTPSTPSA